MLTSADKVGGWVKKGQNHDDVILEWSLTDRKSFSWRLKIISESSFLFEYINKTTQFISIFSKICPISREVPLWQLGNASIRSYKKSRWFQNWFQTRGLYLDLEKLCWKKKMLKKFNTMVLSFIVIMSC